MIDILMIEDNKELASLIQAFLKKEGFSLCHVESGEEAQIWLTTQKARLLLVDIMLPGIDGFALCQFVRRMSNLPILIMSARSTKDDKLMGFELGADDYMEKPVDTDLLCAKVKALLHRSSHNQQQKQIVFSGSLQIDKDARKVYCKDEVLDLNGKEYDLLLLFVENAGKTLHKDYVFNEIWGADSESENQTLTVHVKMLRTKIEEDPKHAKRIQTVWGVGYRYEEI